MTSHCCPSYTGRKLLIRGWWGHHMRISELVHDTLEGRASITKVWQSLCPDRNTEGWPIREKEAFVEQAAMSPWAFFSFSTDSSVGCTALCCYGVTLLRSWCSYQHLAHMSPTKMGTVGCGDAIRVRLYWNNPYKTVLIHTGPLSGNGALTSQQITHKVFQTEAGKVFFSFRTRLCEKQGFKSYYRGTRVREYEA